MLEESRSRRLAHVAANGRQLGLQPARRHRSPQRRAAHARVVRRSRRGAVARRHPARLRRRAVLPEPDRTSRRRSTRRRARSFGSTAARCPPISGSSCRFRRRIATSRSTAGSSSTTAPTTSSTRSTPRRGEHGLGNQDPRLQDPSREAGLRAARRERRADRGTQLPAERRPRRLHHHGPRRAHGQGALAQAHDPEARRARAATAGATCPTNSAGTSAPG